MTFFLQTNIDPKAASAGIDSIRNGAIHFAENLASDPGGTLHQLGQGAIRFGIKVLIAIVIYLVGAWLIKRLRRNLGRIFERRKADKALSSFVTSTVTIALTILLIIFVIGTLGVNTTSLAALLAAGGMAIGMALSGTVQNFAGGLMLLIFKPFKVGDFIEAQGFTGTVGDIAITSTRLTTTDNREIVLPNGPLASGTVINYTRNSIRRIEWNISVEYGTDAAACCEKLRAMLREDPRVLDSSHPGAADPFAAISQLGDSSVVIAVRGWTATANYWELFFDFNDRVYDQLPREGFKFPFPQMDIHIKSDN